MTDNGGIEMWAYPPSFDYRSIVPYLAISFQGDGTVRAKTKTKLHKAILSMFRDSNEYTRFRGVIDGNGYLIISRGGQRGIMGTGETFDTMVEIAKSSGEEQAIGDIFMAELESRIMWPADA
jgi:hypothetical protein